jgi:hypothetical protein
MTMPCPALKLRPVPQVTTVATPVVPGAGPREAKIPGFLVTRSGTAGEMTLRAGDHIVLGPESPGCLLVLVARGYGQPMIGRRMGGRLYAEPSGAPVSTDRWQVAGAIVAIERDLERGGLFEGSWCVAAATRAVGTQEAIAPAAFEGIGLTEHEVDERCIRAALAPDRWATDVALAAAPTVQEAEALLPTTPSGRIRYSALQWGGGPLRMAVGATVSADLPSRGIVLPFGPRVAPERQLPLFA